MKRMLLLTVFALMIVGAAAPPPPDGTAADPFLLYNTANVALAWDDDYTDRDLTAAVVEIYDETEALVETHTLYTVACDGTTCSVPIRAIIQDLHDGLYHFRAKVVDAYMNESTWSATYYASKDWRPLPPPSGGCRIIP